MADLCAKLRDMRANTILLLCAVAAISAALHISAQTAGSQTEVPPPIKLDKIGGNVKPPRVITQTEPEFSEQARAAHYQGVCILKVVVGVDGMPSNVRVVNPLGMGLDEKAVEAVRTWRFEPARKDGEPVAVEIAVEVDFHLLTKDDPRIEKLREKADAGDAKAELDLATDYLEGRNAVPRDQAQGMAFLERAARHGLPRAQFMMGEHLSQGVSPDYAKAYLWYTLAQRGGYKHSDKALKELTAKMTSEQLQAGQALVDGWKDAPAK